MQSHPAAHRKFSWYDFLPKSIFCCFLEKYTLKTFKADLWAGITVGIVALPLAMAFAIASGVAPEQGLFTAIVAGFLISLFGGSRVQIGGPTGAFVVIVYGIIQRQGYHGLVLATLMAALILILMGACRLGTLIKYIPYPLVTGFTTGIAVIIFSSQVKDLLGLHIDNLPADFLGKWQVMMAALPSWHPSTFCVGLGTLLGIIALRKYFPALPWGIFSIAGVTLVCWIFSVPVETVGDRFGEIPRVLPAPALPSFQLSVDLFRSLIPDAITIAFLAGIESLLSAVIADGMTGRRHKSNCELIAQGIGNLGSVFFGGIPATGAIARTATNIKTGAKTPVAGMIHSLVLFLLIFCFAPLVSQIPLTALAAVLVVIAWNMSEHDHFRHLLKAPLGDIAVLLSAFLLTVLVDITIAVEVGMILAAFVFMKRMSDMGNVAPLMKFVDESSGKDRQDPDAISNKCVPKDVEVYEVTGPFFFGVADSLKDILHGIEPPPKVFILRMRKVPVIDASGLHALEEFYEKCRRDKTVLVLSGVKGQPAKAMQKYGLDKLIGKENIHPHIDPALERALQIINLNI
ncbi:MAG: sulfate permease [Rhabdochlamydiaceae bacterium]|nr:sulfate permease [Rhabdochlamydiaceae bacterium]